MYTGDPTTVTPASVAQQHTKPFLCLFCMGYTSHAESQNNTTNLSCLFCMGSIPHMYTGGPHDRNTRQCRTTTQQNFPVSSLHGLYLTCTWEDPTTVTPASVANNTTNLSCVLSTWVIPHMYTGGRCDRNTRLCRTTTQQNFPASFLYGLYFTCTREDPATVTPTSVAKQHDKPFL